MARVIWADEALVDVDAIRDFIARDSPTAAEATVERIIRAAEQLAMFPLSGRVIPEFRDERTREVFAGNYRIFYRVDEPNVVIAAVVHGARSIGDPNSDQPRL